ncbi:MAG TPA: NAD(P)/FAD-dependent oxidoreductase [Dehalococcoidia bacterium]|nr:NAD(P)/FAD-dependent oxidoreductase [Dehalococcoidia bacterium]
MKKAYEVVVVGAGPGGATLAYELAQKGIRVLLLEKDTLPRYKCCAGGVTAKAAKLLNVDINELAEDVVTDVTVNFKGDGNYHGHSNQDLIYTVRRDKFDYALVKQAEAAGAVIVQGQEVKQVKSDVRWVKISTPAGDFRSQFVAGADGANSIVARESGLRANVSYIAGMNTEVVVAKKELAKWRSLIAIDVGFVPKGCGWVFPKLDHLSIGIACLSSEAKSLKRCYREFLNSLNINHYTITKWSGGLIPTCKREAIVSGDRIVLLGDAAGLADPLTGEGIQNALQSAKLAAPVIEECLLNGKARLKNYQQAVDEKIMPEIRIARVLQKMFVRFPEIALKLLNLHEGVWRSCCLLVRGELDYTAVKSKLGGVRGMYAFLSRALVL